MPHRFDPGHLKRLDSPLRRLLMPPRRILKRTGLRRGDVFLDVGAGSGHFTFPAAQAVGPAGKVLAVDVAQEAARLLEEKRKALGAQNVEVIRSSGEDCGVPPGCATCALLATVLHEVGDKERMLDSIRQALRPGGRIGVVEFRKVPGSAGPPMEERIGEEDLRRLLEARGFAAVTIRRLPFARYLATARIPPG